MKSKFDLKHGFAKVKPESPDDLWVLEQVITPGSLAKARTVRSVEVRRGEEKLKAGKRAMTLKIKVEKVELTDVLRLGGKIVEGPEEVPHEWHTLEIEPGTELTLEREWRSWEVDKVKAAEKRVEPVLMLIMDDRDADFYVISDRKKHLMHIAGPGYGKGSDVSKKPEYYKDLIGRLKARPEKHIVVAGPGFAKDELAAAIREREKDLYYKVVLEGANQTGDLGLQEVVKRKVLERIVRSSRMSEETEAVESFLAELGKGGKVAYGRKEVADAADAGAVATLLVSDEKVREFAPVLEKAEKTGARIMIVSSDHPAGERLLAMGGIAALLRYKLS